LTGHFVGQEPPQSTPVSLPSFTPSEHWPATQRRPAEQSPLVQSLFSAQTWPFPHALQVPPPQSTSVSLPSCTPSLHLLELQTPATQMPDEQSAATAQLFPVAQVLRPQT
jgi:hypothetical protein